MPDIPFWNRCDNRCVMCTNLDGFASQKPPRYGLRHQIEKLERWLKGLGPVYLKNADKADFVSLTGGEPTLHPDFFKLLAYFRKRLPGVPITLLTNGRRLSRPAFASRFMKAAKPPFTVGVPLHGGSAAAHDRVAGVKGAFSQTVRGLRNVFAGRAAGWGGGVDIRVVLHRLNIKEFGGILSFLLKEFPAADRYRVLVIHYEIEGKSLENHRLVGLRLRDSAKALDAAAPLIARFPDLQLYHFPLCVVGAKLRPRCRVTLPPEDRVYTAKCAGCRARRKCLGLMAEYHKMYGDGELKKL